MTCDVPRNPLEPGYDQSTAKVSLQNVYASPVSHAQYLEYFQIVPWLEGCY